MGATRVKYPSEEIQMHLLRLIYTEREEEEEEEEGERERERERERENIKFLLTSLRYCTNIKI